MLRKVSFETGLSYRSILDDLEHRRKVLEWMLKLDITQFDEVSMIINLYHKDKKTVMRWVEKGEFPHKKKQHEMQKFLESVTGLKTIKVLD